MRIVYAVGKIFLQNNITNTPTLIALQDSLTASSSPVWFPYVALDQLLAALDRVDGDDSLCQVRNNRYEMGTTSATVKECNELLTARNPLRGIGASQNPLRNPPFYEENIFTEKR